MEKWNWSLTDRAEKPSKFVFWAILSTSTLCLGFSFIMEIWAGLAPCKLCLAQRYTHLGLACLSGLGILLQRAKYLRFFMMLVLLFGLFVVGYQTLTYTGFIESKCSLNKPETGLVAFKESLKSEPSCSKPSLLIFGIPVMYINGLFYLGFIGWLFKNSSTSAQGFLSSTNCD